MSNKLEGEASSYLKAAQNQPINWHPWSEGVFKKAEKEKKPVLLSIGAVWCHWCHVQAHESWENKGIADFINKNFIAVKVDRDERPDIDQKYQGFVQMLTGSGGWPLTVFLSPDKTPFFGGTYFPPDRLKLVLEGVLKTYKNEKDQVEKIKKEISQNMEISGQLKKEDLDEKYIEEGASVIINQMDAFNGGFGGMPKFPMAEALLFLLDYYSKNNREEIWKFLELTLKKMAEGGVYDQLGGGFHRYSVDESWKVPHFEKLLTDNSLLLKVYLKAYQISGEEFYRKISLEILDFLMREFLDEKTGLFYSSQDADSKGTKSISSGLQEGKYFTWTKKEIMEILGEKDGKIFSMHYGVAEEDESSENVLRASADYQDIADIFGLKKEEIEKIIGRSKKILFMEREKRDKPFTDKNSFTGWNCLAASAFLDAYKILGDEKFLDIGKNSLEFILENLYKAGRVYRMFSEGKSSVSGFLDDYIFLAKGLVELYQIAFEEKYLEKFAEILEKAVELFWDKENGALFYSWDRELNAGKPILDFSLPAPNSVAVAVFLDIYHITGKEGYKEKASEILKLFQGANPGYELHKASYLQALNYYFEGPREFFIAGEIRDENVKRFLEAIHKKSGNIIIKVGGNFKDKPKINGKPTIYMCWKNTCSMPITEAEKLEML